MMLDTFKANIFKEKTQKDYPEFTNSVDCLQVDKLNKNLETYAKYLEEILFELKYNDKIKAAALLSSGLNKPYTDRISFLKSKTKELNKFIDDGVAEKQPLIAALLEYNKLTNREMFKRDNDSALSDAKEALSELKAGFSDSKKALDIKIKYLNILILEKELLPELESVEIG